MKWSEMFKYLTVCIFYAFIDVKMQLFTITMKHFKSEIVKSRPLNVTTVGEETSILR